MISAAGAGKTISLGGKGRAIAVTTPPVPAGYANAVVLPRSPVLYYPLAANSTDLGSAAKNGTDTAITYGSAGLTIGSESFNSAQGNGTTSKITTEFFLDTLPSFTFSCWLKIASAGPYHTIFSTSAGYTALTVWISNNRKVYVYGTGGPNIEDATLPALTVGTWYHFALTFTNSGTTRPYLNGSAGTSSAIGDASWMEKFQMFDDGSTDLMNGSIAHAAVFGSVLSAGNIQALAGL